MLNANRAQRASPRLVRLGPTMTARLDCPIALILYLQQLQSAKDCVFRRLIVDSILKLILSQLACIGTGIWRTEIRKGSIEKNIIISKQRDMFYQESWNLSRNKILQHLFFLKSSSSCNTHNYVHDINFKFLRRAVSYYYSAISHKKK